MTERWQSHRNSHEFRTDFRKEIGPLPTQVRPCP
jgi:hypothetical protein